MIQMPTATPRSSVTGQVALSGQAVTPKSKVLTVLVGAAIAVGTVLSIGVVVDDFRSAQTDGTVRQAGISRMGQGTGVVSYGRPDAAIERLDLP